MTTLHPGPQAAHGSNDVDMDDFEIDLTGVGTPMMQDNLEVEDEISYDADLPDAQNVVLSPRSVAMGNDDAEEMVDATIDESEFTFHQDEQIVDFPDVDLDNNNNAPQDVQTSADPSYAQDNAFISNVGYAAAQETLLATDQTSNQSVPLSLGGSQVTNVQATLNTVSEEVTPPAAEEPSTSKSHHQSDYENLHAATILDSGNEVESSTHEEFPHAQLGAKPALQTEAPQELHPEDESGSTSELKPSDLDGDISASSLAKLSDSHEAYHDRPEQDPSHPDSATQGTDENDVAHRTQNEVLHPIIADWDDQRDWLFQPSNSEEHQGFYLQQSALAHESYPRLFEELRKALAGDLGESEELEIDFPIFNTIVREDACQDQCTLADLVNVYVQLHELDGNTAPGPLEVVLRRRTRFATRLAQLQAAVSAKQGLSQLDFLHHDSTASSSEYLEEDDDQKSDRSSPEQEQKDLANKEDQKEYSKENVPHEEEERSNGTQANVAELDNRNEVATSTLVSDTVGEQVQEDEKNEHPSPVQYQTLHEDDVGSTVQDDTYEATWQEEGLLGTENAGTTLEHRNLDADKTTQGVDLEDHLGEYSNFDEASLTNPQVEDQGHAEQYLDTSLGEEGAYEDSGDLIDYGNEGYEDVEDVDAAVEHDLAGHEAAGQDIEPVPIPASVASVQPQDEPKAVQLLGEDDLIDYDDEEDEVPSASTASTPTVQGDGPNVESKRSAYETETPPNKRSRDAEEDELGDESGSKKLKAG